MTDSKLNSDLPPFAMVPRWVIQHTGLTSGAVRVFACLADMAGRDRPAWPSHRTLAIKCNMSVSSVRRHIKELVYAGALTVEPRYKPNGEGQTSNLFTIVNKPVNNTYRSVTKNKGVTTSEQGTYPPQNNRIKTTEQEPLTKQVDQKEQIQQARKKLAK